MADVHGGDDQSSAGAIGPGPAVPVDAVDGGDGGADPAVAAGDDDPRAARDDGPGVPADGGATTVLVGGDGLTEALTAAVPTQSLGAVGEQRTTRLPSGADMARWSGRAGIGADHHAVEVDRTVVSPAPVRAPVPAGPATDPDGASFDDADDVDQAGRPAETAAAATVVALVLLAVLGVGIWLILNAVLDDRRQQGTPAPVVTTASSSPTPTPVGEESQPSETPSSAAPTSAGPTLVEIPSVRGKSRAEAERMLTALGLGVTVEHRDAGSAGAGTVLGTEPAEGTAVPGGSTVTLIVARTPSPSPSSRPPSSSRVPSPSPSGRVMPAR